MNRSELTTSELSLIAGGITITKVHDAGSPLTPVNDPAPPSQTKSFDLIGFLLAFAS